MGSLNSQLVGSNASTPFYPTQTTGLPPAVIIPSLFQAFSEATRPLQQFDCEKAFTSMQYALSGGHQTDCNDKQCFLGFRNTINYTPRVGGCVFTFNSKDHGQPATLTHINGDTVVTLGSDSAKTFATNFKDYFNINTDEVQVRLKQDPSNPNLFGLDVSLKDIGSFSANCVEGETTACTFKGNIEGSEYTATTSNEGNQLNSCL